MTFVLEYESATHDVELARLRRVLALRAMLLTEGSQRTIAKRLGVTQPAISYQVAKERTEGVLPSDLMAAGASILKQMAQEQGFTDLAVFGSVARGEDRPDSDVDLLVQPPQGADMFDLLRLEEAFETVLGRDVDLVSLRGLNAKLDKDILETKMLL